MLSSIGSGKLNNILLATNHILSLNSGLKLSSAIACLIRMIALLFTALLSLSQPLKADLNASYSLGDMLFAAYDIPQGQSAANIRLATELEYSDLGGQLPEFYGSIVIVDRSAAVGELFISTNAPVYDEEFDLIFVNAVNGDVFDWFSLNLVNGRVSVSTIQSSAVKNVTPVVAARRDTTTYNAGNREVVALLVEVSRQLSESREQRGDSAPVRETVAVNSTSLPPAVRMPDPVIETDISPVSTNDGVNPLPYLGATEVVSEVRLATASMKNFVLTIIAAALALALATYSILSKIKGSMSEQTTNSSNLPNAENTSAENVPETATFLNYIKEENRRTQETFLRSLELMSVAQKFDKLSDGTESQLSNVTQTLTAGQVAATQIPSRSGKPVSDQPKPTESVQAFPPSTVTSTAQQNRRVLVGDNQGPGGQRNKTVGSIAPSAKVTAKFQEKIDLAEVYRNMGDIFMAQNLLQEVIKSGNPAEIAKAKQTLAELGDS